MIFDSLIIFILFVETCLFFYPEEANPIFQYYRNLISDWLNVMGIKLFYNSIYYYSVCQLYAIQFKVWATPHVNLLCTEINNFLQQHNILHKTDINVPLLTFEIYENGKNKQSIPILDALHKLNLNEQQLFNRYDFIVLSDNNSQTLVNKIHYIDYPLQLFYSTSNIKFISMDITYKDTVYPIQLQTDSYNHYIVNNVINTQFYKYYLINILHVEIDAESFDYVVNLIDHNVNIIQILPHQYIVIGENDYEIKSEDTNGFEETKSDNEETKSDNEETKSEVTDDNDSTDDYVNLEN
jgi:hypothetical protein